MAVNGAIPRIAHRRPDPTDCPHCHGVALDMTGGRCPYCQNTGRIRPSPQSPDHATTRPLKTTFEAAYEANPGGVMNESTTDWRVYVEPSIVPGRHDIWVQDKIHHASEQRRLCAHPNCKYSDLYHCLRHLTSREPMNALCADQWRPRPF